MELCQFEFVTVSFIVVFLKAPLVVILSISWFLWHAFVIDNHGIGVKSNFNCFALSSGYPLSFILNWCCIVY